MKKRNPAILNKIIEEAAEVTQILDGVDESTFLVNEEKKRAVCMTLINVGELIKNLDEVFRNTHSHIQWKDYAGFRDVAAHGYFTLRMDRVWLYAKEDLPVFTAQIRKILASNEKIE
jgi:uncharacterized protein with HEPN domain